MNLVRESTEWAIGLVTAIGVVLAWSFVARGNVVSGRDAATFTFAAFIVAVFVIRHTMKLEIGVIRKGIVYGAMVGLVLSGVMDMAGANEQGINFWYEVFN